MTPRSRLYWPRVLSLHVCTNLTRMPVHSSLWEYKSAIWSHDLVRSVREGLASSVVTAPIFQSGARRVTSVIEDVPTIAVTVRTAGMAAELADGRAAEKLIRSFKRWHAGMDEATPEVLASLAVARNKSREDRMIMKSALSNSIRTTSAPSNSSHQ